MKMLPLPSTATASTGEANPAAVAGPLSPLSVAEPLPATVMMFPVAWTTSRMRWLSLSAMKRLPLASMATPAGSASLAEVPGPPSPP